MARVTYGTTVTALKGSIGGITFQNNPSGPVVKLKTYFPVNPSSLQAANQTYLAQIVALWPKLSIVQQDAWTVFAAANPHTSPWGVAKTLSGFQWFMACNLNLLSTGQSVISVVPVFAIVPAPDVFSISTFATWLKLNWVSPFSSTVNYNQIFVSPPLRQGNIKLRKSLFYLQTFNSAAVSSIDITTNYINYFNLVWSDFYSYSEAFIIVRIKSIQDLTGFSSAYTSAIVKI